MQFLTPDLSNSTFTVRSINKDAVAMSSTTKTGKKRLRWAKQLERVHIIPSRYCQPMSITTSELALKVRALTDELAAGMILLKETAKQVYELEGLNNRLVSKYAAKLAILHLKKHLDAIDVHLKTKEKEISSMRLDMIQWKGLSSQSQRRKSLDDKLFPRQGQGESFQNFWHGATSVMNKSWASCA